MEAPISYEFTVPQRREAITEEPEPSGDHHDPRFPDVEWIGWAQLGGGKVPQDYEWPTNPRHDRLPEVIGN